jgi:ribosomal protein S15P/S13E
MYLMEENRRQLIDYVKNKKFDRMESNLESNI